MALVYQTCGGLNTLVEPEEYGYTSGEEVFLRSCSNIDITEAGKIKTRAGVGQVHAQELGDCGNGYDAGDFMVFTEGPALSIMEKNGTVSRLRNITPGLRMSCAKMPQGVFHTNGVEHGYIAKDLLAKPWTPPADDVNVHPTREYSGPHVGHLLGTWRSSLLYAYGPHVYKSKPFNPFLYNHAEDVLPTISRATMMREVTGGLWLSNLEGIYFYSGRDFSDFDRLPKYDKPIVEGTDVYVPQHEVSRELPVGLGVIVTAEDAILFLAEDGTMMDLSSDKITIPPGAIGTAMFRGGQYLVNIQL